MAEFGVCPSENLRFKGKFAEYYLEFAPDLDRPPVYHGTRLMTLYPLFSV